MIELQKYQERRSLLYKRARQLYRKRTKAEDALWLELKQRKLGFRFRCQRKIPPYYIVDFVCMEKLLVVEIGGNSHYGREEYDARRTKFLENLGYRVIRFTNEQILNGIDEVLECISWELQKQRKSVRSSGEPITIGQSEYF